jgi:hypothetical protein
MLLSVDCVPGAIGCAPLAIQGDGPFLLPNGQPAPFSGFADPCLRRDPQSGTLWLTYSWPNSKTSGTYSVPCVDTHLASSTDGGSTFTFQGPLWPATPISNPSSPGQAGFQDHEVSNLVPVAENGATTWYAVRMDYFVPAAAGYAGRPGDSFLLKVFKASSPAALATAPFGTLGCAYTNPAWAVDQNLAALSPDLQDVSFWTEPALYSANGTLYLVLQGLVYSGGQPVASRCRVHVFATQPSGLPSSLRWTYKGLLSGADEATVLGGQILSQVEVARGADGKLLMIATPTDWSSSAQDYVHKGCAVVELSSIDPPVLARDTSGQLIRRVALTASDLPPLGGAASCYDPASDTGLLYTRRFLTSAEFKVEIWKTGLRP